MSLFFSHCYPKGICMSSKKHKRELRRRFFSAGRPPQNRAHHRRTAKNAAKLRRNQHHIFCQQRYPELRKASRNIVDVNVIQHDRYHWLFKNRTPEEIIDYLIHYFWGGYIPATIRIRERTSEQIIQHLNDYFGKNGAPFAMQLCALGASEAAS